MKTRTLLGLGLAVLALVGGSTTLRAQATSDLPLIIQNNGSGVTLGRDTLRWGVNPAGTNGRDASLGEDELPPKPPSSVFDVRFVNVGSSNNFGEGVKKNFRASTSPTQIDTFRVSLQAGDGGFPVAISWPNNLSTYFGSATLRYFDNGLGANVNVNMLTSSSTSITDVDVTTVQIFTASPTAPAGGVSVTPSPLNYGIVAIPVPGEKTDSITITNTGGSAATIDSVTSSSAQFLVNTPPSFPLNLAPGASVKVGITFTAAGPGVATSTVRVYHNQAGSPAVVSATATASSGEGLFLLNDLNTVNDNTAGVYKQIVGLKYSGSTGAQGLQFRLTAPGNTLKITGVQLGQSLPNPGNWNFDYEISNAASGSEVQIVLYGQDNSINFAPNSQFDSLFVVSVDVKNIKVCNGGPGGDTAVGIMYLNDIQSSLADDLGTPAGIAADPDRDSSQYNIQNSSSRGDVNCDDRVDILDVLDIIDVVLGRATFEGWQFNRADLAPWSAQWSLSSTVFNDGNNYGDGTLNVQDVTLIVNAILNEMWPDGDQLFGARLDGNGKDGSSLASVYDVKFIYTLTRGGVDVTMDNLVPVKGIQMKIRTSDVTGDLPARIADAFKDRFTLSYKVVGDELRILIYSLSGDAFAPATCDLFDALFDVKNAKDFVVVEPITAGGSANELLKVEYQIVDHSQTESVAGEQIARRFGMIAVPNPTVGRSELRFSLESSSTVTVTVVDEKGTEVARSINGERLGAGEHKVVVDELAAGNYRWVLNADGVIASRPLVVVR